MIRRHLLPRALAIAAAACVLPSAAQAQRWFAGVGGTLTAIDFAEVDVSAVRPGLHGVVGYRLGRGISTGVEFSLYGLGDDEPRTTDFVPGTTTQERIPEIVRTRTLFAFVQLDAGPVYVRPALGVAGNTFASYLFGAGDQVLEANTSSEGGPGAGIAAGYAVPVGGRASVNFEGVAAWSGGEDSSTDRYVYGLRIVPTLRF